MPDKNKLRNNLSIKVIPGGKSATQDFNSDKQSQIPLRDARSGFCLIFALIGSAVDWIASLLMRASLRDCGIYGSVRISHAFYSLKVNGVLQMPVECGDVQMLKSI